MFLKASTVAALTSGFTLILGAKAGSSMMNLQNFQSDPPLSEQI
jgi:hypothetical protein